MEYTYKKMKMSYILALACFISHTQIKCNSTAVQLANINPTDPLGGSISAPGHYYLGWDIAGPITIAADRVTLNLNGHIVQQVIISNQQDIRLMNGVVDPNHVAGNGIAISSSQNIHLTNLTIQNADNAAGDGAINLNGCSFVFVKNCTTHTNFFGLVTDATTTDLFISNSVFAQGTSGLGLASTRTIIRNCEANENTTNGFRASQTQFLYLHDCIARRNTQSGYSIFPNSNATAFGCLATDNTDDGFTGSTNCQINWIECIAQQNGGRGFYIEGDAPTRVLQCSAMYNGGCGFDDNTGTSSLASYAANVSFLNAVSGSDESNYCNGGSCIAEKVAPFCYVRLTDDDAQYWRNVSTATSC